MIPLGKVARIFQDNPWFLAGLLFLVGAAVYLPMIRKLGLYLDDWFELYDAHSQGANYLNVVFSIDRPARGVLLSFVYTLLGDHLVFYQLTSYLFRYGSALAFFLTLNIVWPGKKSQNFLMALLFMVFPAYIDQFEPIDFYPMSVSLCLAMISIGLSIKALTSSGRVARLTFLIIAILAGWIYLALVEHYVGFEFLRIILVFFTVIKETRKQVVKRTVLRWLPYSLIPIVFTLWRAFIFNSHIYIAYTRPATDVASNLKILLQSTYHSVARWGVAWLYSTINVAVSSWIAPFYLIVATGVFRFRETLWIILMSIGVTFLILIGLYLGKSPKKEEKEEADDQNKTHESSWILQVAVGGILSLVLALLPLILINRNPPLLDGGHFLIVAAPGAAMLVVAGIHLLRSSKLQMTVTGLLLFFAITTEYGAATNYVNQFNDVKDFWWQVSWRAPQFEEGTTLLGYSYKMYTPEDSTIWGPANFIYDPQKQTGYPIEIKLPAIIPDDGYLSQILAGNSGFSYNRRGNITKVDFNKLLIVGRPDIDSCVHVIDGNAPEFSENDPIKIVAIANYSNPQHIIVNSQQMTPPVDIFGSEPEHTWCYYYEKAEQARQSQDWSSIIAIGAEAASKGFKPANRIEWLPFLQAYAATGQADKLQQYSNTFEGSDFMLSEVCKTLRLTAKQTNPNDPVLTGIIENSFCVKNATK
jgi:hypothetical protein